jgi:hypothetical protein
MSKLTLQPITRQSRLAAWFALYGVSHGEIAEQLGVTRQMVTKICTRETAPARHLEAMKAMGVPGYLLPQPTGGNGRSVDS